MRYNGTVKEPLCLWESLLNLSVPCTSITTAPNNLIIMLFVGMGDYNDLSKFQSDSTYKS